MTSLREASGGRPIDRGLLLDAFLDAPRGAGRALRGGRFDVDDWTARQLTTGRIVRLEGPTARPEDGRAALGVDPASGGLLVADPGRRAASGRSTPARSSTAPAGRRPGPRSPAGCNGWPDAVFRKVTADGRSRRVVHLDRDRASSRRPSATRPGSTPCIGSTSPRCTATPTTSSAITTTPRTSPSGRSCSPSAPCPGSRSAPDRPTARAPPRSGSGSSGSPGTSWPTSAGRAAGGPRRRSTPRRRRPPPLDDLEARRRRGDEAAEALGRGRSPARRPPPRARPALRRGDVHGRDRRRPRPLRGRGPGPHPSRPARRRPRPGPSASDERLTGARRREIEALVTDRYLEALLAAGDAAPTDAPSVAELDPARPRAPPPAIAPTLIRVHPSFRFEERLAAPAGRGRRPDAARPGRRAEGASTRPGSRRGDGLAAPAGPSTRSTARPARPESPRAPASAAAHRRALASAALSIAGAAFVAWRLSRPAATDERAVRAARERVDGVRLA